MNCQKLHIASQIGGKSVTGNAEINVLLPKHRRWAQLNGALNK